MEFIHTLTIVFFAIFFPLVSGIPCATAAADTAIDERYDENTEITVRGTVGEQISTGPRGMGRGRGPVILTIKTRNKSYQVVTAPAWYLERHGLSFTKGSTIEVRGSRFYSSDGTVYLIAREIRDPASSKVSVLRDSTCRPVWHGHRMMNR